MGVAIAGAGGRHIDGEYQGLHPRSPGPLQRILHEPSVAQDIELEPHGPVDGRRHLLNGADRDGGQGEGHAARGRRLGRLHLAAPGVHAGQADWRQDDRQPQGLVEQPCFQAEAGHVL